MCVNGGSGPRPAVMYSVFNPTPVNAATAIQLHYGGGPSMGRSVAAPKARQACPAGVLADELRRPSVPIDKPPADRNRQLADPRLIDAWTGLRWSELRAIRVPDLVKVPADHDGAEDGAERYRGEGHEV